MLAIDCGNSRIKWARFEAGCRAATGTANLRDAGEALGALGAALVDGIDRVLVANVAGAALGARIAAEVSSRLSITAEFVGVEPEAYGITCAYREYETLGVDRWLAMIACRQRVDGAFAVVGAGTALTFDAVDGDGRHLGGLILPGDRLMIEALASHTEQIGRVPPAAEPVTGLDLLGRSTAEAVANGSRLALAAAVDRAVDVVAAALGTGPRVLVTGGDAAVLAGWLASRAEVSADLVLEGLAAMGHAEGQGT